MYSKLDAFVSDFCWDNLPGDQLWSNNLLICALGGAKIAEKENKKRILDLLNKYRSWLSEETTAKIGRSSNFKRETELRAKIEVLQELLNKK